MHLLFDIEANGFYDQATKIWCISIAERDEDGIWGEPDLYGPNSLSRALDRLAGARCLVGHNIISYDLPVLRKVKGFKFQGKVLDTLVVSRFLFPERWGGHGLEDWGKRLKFPKIEYNDWSRYTEEMGVYCNNDVILNCKVLEALEQEAKQQLDGHEIYNTQSPDWARG